KGVVYILNNFFIFVVRTKFIDFNENGLQNIQELTARRRGASPSTLQTVSQSMFVRSDLAAVAQISKQNIMRTNIAGGNATAPILATINVQEIVQKANDLNTTVGFVKEYFNQLPHYVSRINAFNAVSVMYYNYFGHFRYNSFQDFQKTIFADA
ncbi:MAG: hypothetical protein KDD03_13345, partial [Gelidibacter sp.]|nr:hypothetical protein [Gelidibacter sp.]